MNADGHDDISSTREKISQAMKKAKTNCNDEKLIEQYLKKNEIKRDTRPMKHEVTEYTGELMSTSYRYGM